MYNVYINGIYINIFHLGNIAYERIENSVIS